MSRFTDALADIEDASLEPIGEGKFGAQYVMFPNGTEAVLKFKQFEQESFRGVPKETLQNREVAVYRLDRDLLHFDVVPETAVVVKDGKQASVQLKVEGDNPRGVVPGVFDRNHRDWKLRIAKLFTRVNLSDLHKIVVLDLICNNVDRHAKNVIIDTLFDRVWAIDNGLAFAPYYRNYRNVFHKYLYYSHLPMPREITSRLEGITKVQLAEVLGEHLSEQEIEQTHLRIKFMLDHKDRLGYHRLSGGNLMSKDFPSYEQWFWRQQAEEEQQQDPALVFAPSL